MRGVGKAADAREDTPVRRQPACEILLESSTTGTTSS